MPGKPIKRGRGSSIYDFPDHPLTGGFARPSKAHRDLGLSRQTGSMLEFGERLAKARGITQGEFRGGTLDRLPLTTIVQRSLHQTPLRQTTRPGRPPLAKRLLQQSRKALLWLALILLFLLLLLLRMVRRHHSVRLLSSACARLPAPLLERSWMLRTLRSLLLLPLSLPLPLPLLSLPLQP